MNTSEVLIIGGGVIGACSALYLTRQGKQVTLVEKQDICAGASHGDTRVHSTAFIGGGTVGGSRRGMGRAARR